MSNPVVANILYGNAILYKGPTGETIPADTVAAGTAWGGNWVRVGYTTEGVTASYEDEQVDIKVQEELGALKRFKSDEALSLETVLAELTATYLEVATGAGAVSTTAAGAGQPAKEEFDIGGEAVLDEAAWGLEGIYRNSSGTEFPVRIFVHKATAKMNGGLEFAKDKENGSGIPLQINALVDTSQSTGEKLMKFQRITAAASS